MELRRRRLFFRLAEVGDRVEHVRRYLLDDRRADHLSDRRDAEDRDGRHAGDARRPPGFRRMEGVVPGADVQPADHLSRAIQILDRLFFLHALIASAPADPLKYRVFAARGNPRPLLDPTVEAAPTFRYASRQRRSG